MQNADIYSDIRCVTVVCSDSTCYQRSRAGSMAVDSSSASDSDSTTNSTAMTHHDTTTGKTWIRGFGRDPLGEASRWQLMLHSKISVSAATISPSGPQPQQLSTLYLHVSPPHTHTLRHMCTHTHTALHSAEGANVDRLLSSNVSVHLSREHEDQ